MQPISEYIRGVMQVDPVAGNELLRLNFKHVAKELNIPENPEQAEKMRNAKKKKNH